MSENNAAELQKILSRTADELDTPNSQYPLHWLANDLRALHDLIPAIALQARQQALAPILALHQPETVQAIVGAACMDEECDHDSPEECPASPVDICSECDRLAEEVSVYHAESGIAHVAYPCPTVVAATTGTTNAGADTTPSEHAPSLTPEGLPTIVGYAVRTAHAYGHIQGRYGLGRPETLDELIAHTQDELGTHLQAARADAARNHASAQAWDEGVATALSHARRAPDRATLILEHTDGTPWDNPYAPTENSEAT